MLSLAVTLLLTRSFGSVLELAACSPSIGAEHRPSPALCHAVSARHVLRMDRAVPRAAPGSLHHASVSHRDAFHHLLCIPVFLQLQLEVVLFLVPVIPVEGPLQDLTSSGQDASSHFQPKSIYDQFKYRRHCKNKYI